MDPSKEPVASGEQEALKKKVAELEAFITRAKHIGAAVVIAVGILLGVGIMQAPAAIGKVVHGYLKAGAQARIDGIISTETEKWVKGPQREAIVKMVADELRSALPNEISRLGIKPTIVVGNAQRGCAVAGAMQYCWGTSATDQPTDNPHIRLFNPTFAREFANKPTVTASAVTNSNGTTYAVYGFDRTTKGFSGVLVSSEKGAHSNAPHKVQLTYFAVAPTARADSPPED